MQILEDWEPWAWDALNLARTLTAAEWPALFAGLKDKRKQSNKWGGQFGAIAVPETLLKITIIADQFCAPWGTAFIRLEEAGKITIVDKRVHVDLGIGPKDSSQERP